MTDDASISCRAVARTFGSVRAVDGLDLDVPRGALVALLGPSGCGKTTLLRMIAGFDRPDAGTITVDGRPVAGPGTHVPPERRGIGMVFQDYALFPHLDVAGNVGYGLGRRPDGRRVAEMLELVGLTGLERRRPDELSGGQQQRVALARALAGRPHVVLLDEPFSNLDAALRTRLRGEVRRILREAGVAGLLVTHDHGEALGVADRVAVVHDGRVAQEGPPEEVYDRPATHWVAGFLGEVDVLRGPVVDGRVRTALGPVDAPPGLGDAADVLVRPEQVEVAAPDGGGGGGAGRGGPGGGASDRGGDDGGGTDPGDADAPWTDATVVDREYHGHDQLLTLRLPGGEVLRHRGSGRAPWRPGDVVRVRLAGTPAVLPGAPSTDG
jgi:iron(III) transport system ATP-binding protein